MSVRCGVQCCVDSLGVTEVVAACFERQVFTRSEHKKQKKNKSSEHGRLVSARLEISQPAMSFPSPTVSLLVYGYRLMSPLAPPWALVGGEQ